MTLEFFVKKIPVEDSFSSLKEWIVRLILLIKSRMSKYLRIVMEKNSLRVFTLVGRRAKGDIGTLSFLIY